MRTTIKTFALALFTLMVSKTFANNDHPTNFKAIVNASGTHFATPPSDSWTNVNSSESVKAAYGDFDGEAFVTLVAYDKQTDVAIDLTLALTQGQFEMIVENSAHEIVYRKTFTSSDSAQAVVTLDVYEEYKIRFVGHKTAGAYICKWTQQ